MSGRYLRVFSLDAFCAFGLDPQLSPESALRAAAGCCARVVSALWAEASLSHLSAGHAQESNGQPNYGGNRQERTRKRKFDAQVEIFHFRGRDGKPVKCVVPPVPVRRAAAPCRCDGEARRYADAKAAFTSLSICPAES